jgi:predicted dehydrogenase
LRAREVTARVRGEAGIDLYDAATVTFDGGAIGVIAGAPSVPEEGRARLRLSISGDAGILDLDVDLDRCEIERHDGGRRSITPAPARWLYRCNGPVHRLIELAHDDVRENLSPGGIGARSVELIEAMLRSAAAQGSMTTIG